VLEDSDALVRLLTPAGAPAPLAVSVGYIDCAGSEVALLPLLAAAAPDLGLPTLVLSLSWHLWSAHTAEMVKDSLAALAAHYPAVLCDGVVQKLSDASDAAATGATGGGGSSGGEVHGTEWRDCYLVAFSTVGLDRRAAAAALVEDVEGRVRAEPLLATANAESESESEFNRYAPLDPRTETRGGHAR